MSRVIAKGLMLIGSCVLGLGVIEAGLRLTGHGSDSLHTVTQQSYERVPGMWEPGQEIVATERPDLPYQVRVDSRGFRSTGVIARSGAPRVVFVGDSFTFGQFVNDDETLPAQVGDRLGVEAINAGVGGTTIVDQRIFLERALSVNPDVAVVVFFENDLDDLRAEIPQHVQFARNRKLKSGLLAPVFLVLRGTALFHVFMEIRAGWIRNSDARRSKLEGGETRESTEWVEQTAATYAAEVVGIREMLAARGIPLVVAAFPHPWSVRGDRAGLPDRITPVKRELQKRGISIVDLTLALVGSGRPVEELYLLPKDGHASPLGYGVAAEALAPEIARVLRDRGTAERSALMDSGAQAL
jgi:lysophospholipase L1-like esterase